MADDATKRHAAINNSLSDAPQPFHSSFRVVNQPCERKIYLQQIIPIGQ